MCFPSQRRALFRHLSEVTFRPSRAPNHWKKHTESRLSYLFAHLHLLSSHSSDFLPLWSSPSPIFSSLTLRTSAFPSLHIVVSLTPKLPSIMSHHIIWCLFLLFFFGSIRPTLPGFCAMLIFLPISFSTIHLAQYVEEMACGWQSLNRKKQKMLLLDRQIRELTMLFLMFILFSAPARSGPLDFLSAWPAFPCFPSLLSFLRPLPPLPPLLACHVAKLLVSSPASSPVSDTSSLYRELPSSLGLDPNSMPDEISDRMPDKPSDWMTYKRSDRMSEYMSDKNAG